MSMQSCLITGAGGFMGRHVSLSLARRGIRVYALYRKSLPPVHPNIRSLQGDVREPHAWESALPGQIDACIHLAALLPGPQFSIDDYNKINVLGTKNVLDAASAHRSRVFINFSSAYVTGATNSEPQTEETPPAPQTAYHSSKLESERICEDYCKNAAMRILTYRISSPYGVGMPHHSLMGIFLNNALQSKPFNIWGTGKRCQNFIHVSDVVRACHCGLRQGEGVFLIAGKESVSTTDLARIFIDISGKNDLPIHYDASKSEDSSWFFDISKAKESLNFSPKISLDVGCRQLYSFLKRFSA